MKDYYTSEQIEGKFMNEVTTHVLTAWCEESKCQTQGIDIFIAPDVR